MSKNFWHIALGALLHDIGKFLQRAEIYIDNLNSYKEDFCPFNKQKGGFTHLHSAYSAYFIEHIVPEDIVDKRELYNAARHHLNPSDDIYTLSDWLSSDMERYQHEQDEEQYKQVLLHSVFDQIELKYRITKDKKLNSRWCYRRVPLTPEGLFPKICENITERSYTKLCESFLTECEEIKSIKDIHLYFNEIYYLLEKYTWCIPSATNVFPDISLFDHLKTTSAIATCFAHLRDETQLDNEKEFLLFAGDISGIQDYIFRITQAQGIGSVAKRLRGRSFFVSMFNEVISRYIINRLGYFLPNVNFCGGGNFELLLANTRETIEGLKEFEREITEYLIKEFYGSIGFVSAMLPVSGKELKEDFGRCKEKLEYSLAEAKQRKFSVYFKKNSLPFETKQEGRVLKICPSCNLQIIEKETEPICNYCKNDKKTGETLLKAQYLSFTIGHESPIDNLLRFGNFGGIGLHDDINNPATYDYIYWIGSNEKDEQKVKAIFPLLKTVPFATEFIKDLKTEQEEEEETEVHSGQTLTFNTIASMSEGDRKIGVLKIDVDDLGLIFSKGLDIELQQKKFKTISRLSSLSRQLSYFFTYVIKKACDEVFQRWLDESDWELKEKISNIFYIVFSGGDDLFVIGPWNRIVDLAVNIREKFKAFTCYNPNLTISAGVFICKPQFPITIAAKKAEEALKKAKSNNKNQICIYDESVPWDRENKNSRIFQDELKEIYELFEQNEVLQEWIYKKGATTQEPISILTFKELMDFAKILKESYRHGDISRRFIHNFLLLSKRHFTQEYNEKKKRYEEIHNEMIFPYLFYNISRNVKSKDVKEKLKTLLITQGKAISYVRQAGIPCQYVLMITRK